MIVELRPEMEALIQKRLQGGGFSTAEEVVERALQVFGDQEDALAGSPQEIAAKIQEAWEEARRGELSNPEEVRARLQEFKDNWRKQRQP